MTMTFTRMMPSITTRTYPNHHRNDIKAIVASLAEGKAVTFKDVAGLVHNSPVQGVRKEGGRDYWLVTVKGIEVCCKAA